MAVTKQPDIVVCLRPPDDRQGVWFNLVTGQIRLSPHVEKHWDLMMERRDLDQMCEPVQKTRGIQGTVTTYKLAGRQIRKIETHEETYYVVD